MGKPVYVGLRGGLGNCLLEIGFGKWAESLGENVKYVEINLAHDASILQLLPQLNVQLTYPYSGRFAKIKSLNRIQKLHVLKKRGYYCKAGWQPECLRYLNMDHPSTDDAIGIHIRRGDYLKPQISSKSWGRDLCRTQYFNNVRRAILNYNLPVKIFSDDLETIPSNVKDLFPDAQYISNSTLEDFYALSSCKVIVVYGSTFSCCAAALNTNAVVYYPLTICKAFRQTNWTAIPLD